MFKYEAEKRYDQTLHWIARHLPRRLLMWCYIVVAAHATTTGEYATRTPDDISLIDGLKIWENK